MKITLIANETTFVYNLRREILSALIADGHQVTVLAQVRSHKAELEQLGCKVQDVEISRRGANPLDDLILMWKLLQIFKKDKPDVVLSNNIKPNVYGGLACRILGIRYLANITGLGTAVEYPGKMQQLTTRLYRWGVAGADCIFFQNEENMDFFRNHRMMPKKSRICLLPGSGVNLETHPVLPYTPGDTVHFLFVARLLKEKGIDLYLAAAKRIAEKHRNVMFHICGLCDDLKYIEVVKVAEAAGYIMYHGEQKNMTPFFEMAHCVVHPSNYPEGMSNVLLEAAASGRPVITTNRSGCRETVDAGVSGYVIPIQNEDALVQALESFLKLSWEVRQEMGMSGRRRAEQLFDRKLVIKQIIEHIEINEVKT